MNVKRIMATIIAICMVFGTVSFNVFAEETTYVAKIGDVECADATSIISALQEASGDVTVEIYGKVETGGFSFNNSDITKLTFVAMSDIAEICIDGVSYIDVRYTEYPIEYNGLILSHINAGQNIDGFLPQYFSTYNGGNVTYTECEFPNGVTACGSAAGTTYKFTNCIFNNMTSGLYSLWIYGNSTNVIVEGGSFNGIRGIKLYSEGNNDFSNLTVRGATFSDTITEKHAIVLTKGESVTLEENTFNNTTGILQVDDGNAALIDGKIVIIDETEYVVDGENLTLVAPFLSGEGTEETPYLINNINDLKTFRDIVDEQKSDGTNQFAGKHFKLTADIDLDEDGDGIGENWNPIGSMTGDHGSFKGIFDGDGHTISNLNVQTTGDGLGFFAYTTGEAEIKNVTFNNVTVKSSNNSNYVGGVVGNAFANTVISNVHITGKINISGRGYIGGIVGHGYVVIEDSSVKGEGTIDSTFWCAGGMVGYAGEGTTNITNSVVEGTGNGIVIRSAAGGLGAIVGMAEDNGGTQPISGSNLVAKNVLIQTYVGAYGNSYAEYGLGYVYGGNPTSILNNVTIENITFDAQGNTNPAVSDLVACVDGLYYTSLEKALEKARELTGPVEINFLGNTVTPAKAIVIDSDKNYIIKDGIIDLTDLDATASEFVDNAGIYAVPVTVMGKLTLDNAKIIGENVVSSQGVVIIGTAGEFSLINDAEINLKDVEATAVIYGDGTAPKFSMGLGTKLVYDGNNNGAETRGILSAELNVEGSTIELKNLNDNALRNVTGTVNNSEITVNGAEYGIKNDASISALTVTDSKITVTNTQNSTENAGIYLTGRDKLADSNSIINAKIFIDGGEDGEDVQIITINFETNGGSVICTVEKTLGEEVNLLLYTPTKSNYKFAGWYSDSELTQKVNTVTVDAPIVVYAKWDRKSTPVGIAKYTLTFETNGGTSVNSISKTKNTGVDLSGYITEKEGYIFDGWYKDEQFNEKITYINITKNTTVFAKWVEKDTGKSDNWFKDVKENDWFYEDVKYVFEKGLMNGLREETFAPQDNLTRAMLVTILYRNEGEPAFVGDDAHIVPSFADIDMGAYYTSAVIWAQQNGIVNGVNDTEFAPDALITREQLATIMHRYAQYKKYDVAVGENTNILSYEDYESISEYAISAIQYACGSGLINGKSESTINPLDNASRAEVAAIIHRFVENR